MTDYDNDNDTDGLDEITLTPSQTESIHASIKHALKPHAEITEGLTAWATAKRAITKTIEYGFDTPMASITIEDALTAIESASSLADRLRLIADNLERETESYQHEVKAMK